jgi:predicted transcriptional regulator
MSRQLNLRVSDQFADNLDRMARRMGKPMATVLEALGTPALEAAETDAIFESEALEAWEEYQLKGVCLTTSVIDEMFADAFERAKVVLKETDSEP